MTIAIVAHDSKKELMAQNKMQGNMFKMDNDPRIIGSEKGPGKGIGNIIRSLSIDELPQFYNILRGTDRAACQLLSSGIGGRRSPDCRQRVLP